MTDGAQWYVVVHQVNDAEVEGTGYTNTVYNIQYIPKPPGTLELVPGGSDGNTVVMFAASADGGSSYHLYDSETADVLPLTPTVTHAPGSGLLHPHNAD